jgi:dienelactone hydrolase
MIKKTFFLFLPLLLLHFPARASETDTIVKHTFVYAVKGADTLRLDKYDTPEAADNKPCMVFVFGGGFAAGKRDDPRYLSFYQQMARYGYAVVAIDYRLGMKNIGQRLNTKQRKLKIFNQVVGIFEQSIAMAVEDLFDATAYVIEHAADWHIDPGKIVSCGSSAGAITVLQGTYELCNAGGLSARLPQGFAYAGVISFAGAIFSTSGRLQWSSPPPPIQMFHGDADREVPYDKIKFRRLGFFGSRYIADQLEEMNAPSCFYSVENTGHEIATLPMQQNWDEVHTFLEKLVAGKDRLLIRTTVKPTDKPEGKKKLTFGDLMGNFKL